MFRKIEIWILYLVIVLIAPILVVFGSLVRHALLYPDSRFTPLTKSALFFAEIPTNLVGIFGESDLVFEDRFPDRAGFAGRPLDQEAYLLLSRYDGDLHESVVELIDLSNFNVLHTWNPDISYINSFVDNSNGEFKFLNRDQPEKRYEMSHPLITSDGSLIFKNNSPLVKIDYCSDLVWQNQEDRFHHLSEFDVEGNIWTLTKMYPFEVDEKYVGTDFDKFIDDGIAKVSQTGQILFQKSVSQLLIENDMKYLLFSVGDKSFTRDPIHLNDIQPVSTNTEFWERGDVFLSLRHQSMLILYRPRTDEIIWIGTGHTHHQHDVDIISDHQIAVFNNNSIDSINGDMVDGFNEVGIYDFITGEYSTYLEESLIEHDVRTITMGGSEILNNGDLFVEESDFGRTLYFDAQGSLRWEHVNRATDGNVYGVFWSRILYQPEEVSMIQNIRTFKSCNDEP